jgi:E3 ubiquitin-protein ligase HECTD1
MNNRESFTVWREILQGALEELTQLLQEEGVVSAYELHSSGLVQALLSLLSTSCWDEGLHSNKSSKLQKQRVRVFRSCFKVNRTSCFNMIGHDVESVLSNTYPHNLF